MNKRKIPSGKFHSIRSLWLYLPLLLCLQQVRAQSNPDIAAYEVDPKTANLRFFWQNDQGEIYRNFSQLQQALSSNGQEMIFAMNGGMFDPGYTPAALYIEDGVEKVPLDTVTNGFGNLYLQPNGVFYINEDKDAVITTTQAFKDPGNIAFATQSGPMLLIDGAYHPKFNQGSASKHIRNGVGVLPNGNLLFAISRERINFYSFARFFKDKGCKNALYLDGAISKAFIPEEGLTDLGGDFGVIIAVSKKK